MPKKSIQTIDLRRARRLALARAGLLKPDWTGLPHQAGRGEKQQRRSCHRLIASFGYLQLDSIPVAGARSHAIVLLSRLRGLQPRLCEELLQPGEPLFEYWGHEACWMPLQLYPLFAFRRRQFRQRTWWGDVLGENRGLEQQIIERISQTGPLTSGGLWGQESPLTNHFPPEVVRLGVLSLWLAGRLAIRQRQSFRRTFDLAENVIPYDLLEADTPLQKALPKLLQLALAGHGWATRGTLASTWRLRKLQSEVTAALSQLQEEKKILPCRLINADGSRQDGWIRPADLELASGLSSVRPRKIQGRLLSPFDPLLWDRQRVQRLFGFHQVIEIYKPVSQRRYGYYCLPVLAGDRLVARVDLKAYRRKEVLRSVSRRLENPLPPGFSRRLARQATLSALDGYANKVGLRLTNNCLESNRQRP